MKRFLSLLLCAALVGGPAPLPAASSSTASCSSADSCASSFGTGLGQGIGEACLWSSLAVAAAGVVTLGVWFFVFRDKAEKKKKKPLPKQETEEVEEEVKEESSVDLLPERYSMAY